MTGTTPGENASAGSGNTSHGKRKELGRNQFNRSRNKMDRRTRNDEYQERKRRKLDEGETPKAHPFSQEEIAAEARRPKKKVAVLVGYAGTGYKGMQLNGDDPTIERDLFAAFVAAGAISKANADDPKKSSLARCARTDKGVHAAGNVISLKMTVEDGDIVDKVNAHLPSQIRMWGFVQTNRSFNCYQSCESRWYEYLMPSHCLLPPHPDTYLWKKLVASARDEGKYDEFQAALKDVEDFWPEVEEKEVKPFLAGLAPEVVAAVRERLAVSEDQEGMLLDSVEDSRKAQAGTETADGDDVGSPAEDGDRNTPEATNDATEQDGGHSNEITADEKQPGEETPETAEVAEQKDRPENGSMAEEKKPRGRAPTAVDFALRDLKLILIKAKQRYRISSTRLQTLQSALDKYIGTKNFHNYTVQKRFDDPSALRHIKSFKAEATPIVIGTTEWLSLRVHGQSFMMHQIRKMVAMAALVTRCGTALERMDESFGRARIAIPKAPGLGLWLERPVFHGYNTLAKSRFEKEPIDFEQYEERIREFKDREIYRRIYQVEEEASPFYTFFQQVDSFKSDYFLWLTASGLEACKVRTGKREKE